MKIAVLPLATFSVASTSEGVKLLVHGQHKGMERSTSHLLHPLVGQSSDPFGFLEEFSVAMSALTLIELWSLAASPGVQISLRIDCRAVVISTGDLNETFALEAFNF